MLLLGKFPQANSTVAPGLSAFFNLRFLPDSLSSFNDELKIEISNGEYFTVPIIAKRKPPVLSSDFFFKIK